MPSVGKVKKQLKRAFSGEVAGNITVTAEKGGSVILTGELERWHEVVKAGMIAAAEFRDAVIQNDIQCRVDKPLPVRKPRIEDSQLEFEEPDVLIIGAGVIGCAIARELSRYSLNVLVVDKEHDVGMHTTAYSTGLVHSGVRQRRGTVKSWFTKQGNEMLEEVCRDLDVPFKRYGQYLIYTSRMWKPFLFISQYYWRLRGIKNAQIVRNEALHNLQPQLNQKFTNALYLPSGGAVCPHTLTVAYAENSADNGVSFSFDTMVSEITVEEGIIKSVTTNRGTVRPKVVINAAGAFCEDIAGLAGDRFYSIHPIKGTCVVIDKKYADELATAAVSVHGRTIKGKTIPTENFHSVLRTVHDTVIAGPFYLESINKEDYTTDRYSVDMTLDQDKPIIPGLDRSQCIEFFAGIGAATYTGDYIISQGKAVTNMIHVAGIQFPGVTASPAIAADVAEKTIWLLGGKNNVSPNPNFNPKRTAPPVLSRMDAAAAETLISGNPDYGIIVCYCEQVSRGEITDTLERSIHCDTVDGVKKRTRAGCGTCQGECCTPGVLTAIASAKRVAPHHIRKSGSGSDIVYGNTSILPKPVPVVVPIPTTPRPVHDSDALLTEKLHELGDKE